MGYNAGRIGAGQLLVLIGLLTALLSMVALYRLILPPAVSFILPVLLTWTSGGVFLIGCVVTVGGILEGSSDYPFDLFVIGCVMIAGSVGFFVAAGIIHWDAAVNPLWIGPGPKPEAALLGFYGSVQTAVSVLAILRSFPPILRETRRMAHV